MAGASMLTSESPHSNEIWPTPDVQVTQRAYTLRLRGIEKTDHAWRAAVWATHEAVNNGAKVFGDWLLILRGGLDHALADEPHFNPQSVEGQKLIASTLKDLNKAKKKEEADPTEQGAVAEIERRRDARIRDRRILLALSWLSVESSPNQHDPHEKFVVASGENAQSTRDEKVIGALRKILAKRAVTKADIESWIADCEPSLSAAIRDDAVWINRSAMFDAAQIQVGPSLTREEVWDLLEPFFGARESYLAPINPPDDSDDDAPVEEDKAKDLVQKAGQWLSSRFGTGKGADFSEMAKVYDAIASWADNATSFASGSESLHSMAESLVAFSPESKDADGILSLISGPGYKSATRNIIKAWESRIDRISGDDFTKLKTVATDDCEKCKSNTGGKGRRPWSDRILKKVESACGFTYLQRDGPARHSEFAVMLDHAARRVSIGHTWIKRAESERQRFQVDSAKIEKVPTDITAWLARFCDDRSIATGAIGVYRIRRRAVGGWKEVVAKWSNSSCKTAEDRIAGARNVQADPDIDKFGDIQLFEALAADDAVVVWRVNGEGTPQPLIDYATATDALAKQKRFKVPAYRHPDPLSHPVFCDFGNSRWEIRFALHDAASKLTDAKATVARREKDLVKTKERLAKARTPEKQEDAKWKLKQDEDDLSEGRDQVAWLESRHALSMGLWDGGKLGNNIPLRWSCKRLTKDIGLRSLSATNAAVNVTRADRLGRAAVGAGETSPVSILGVFSQADWNGRLQAPRSQLDKIAKHVKDLGWDAKAEKMRDRIQWLVSFSAKLQPAGPWLDYVPRFSEDTPAKPFVSRRGEYAVKHQTNDARSGHAKLILSRLPNLRVLSVDLGHRFAAACAVWETLSLPDLLAEISGRTISAGGTGPENLYLHTRLTGQNGKVRTTIYRRIGADNLSDGQRHPAPWARLDRQFIIKLPGEDKTARAASKEGQVNEIAMVAKLAADLGLVAEEDREKGRNVDELMARAVRIIALGLKRHARRAKIACAFDPKTKTIPGIGGSETPYTPGDAAHIKLITDALFDWHALASESKWDDKPARDLWNQHISPITNGWRVEDPKPCDETAGVSSRQQRRKEDDVLREKLKPMAVQLAAADRSVIHVAWRDRWQTNDGNPANPGAKAKAAGLYAHLRWLTDWIMGRRLPGVDKKDVGWKQNVGGLSLTRIATMKSLYQLHKAFAMRPKPDKPRGAPEKGETNAGVAQSILDAMEQMREQRVKQLASRIAGSALGLGGQWQQVKTRRKNADGSTLMKWVWVEEPTSKYPPCHAVVIENLTNYRPDELQTRRENRQLMSWSSSKVKKYLSEACQLHGLHLPEVQAGYTSRQDSRTGAPGIRCADVPVVDFMTKPWWRRQVRVAREKADKGDARDRFLVTIEKQWSSKSDSECKLAPAIRIPMNGGELFVSADPCSPAAKGLQADLNAAANVGMKALLDPDFSGRRWFVPCESTTHKPHAEKTKGSLVIDTNAPLVPLATIEPNVPEPKTGKKQGRSKAGKKEREIINLWRDVSASPIDTKSPWRGTAEYWIDVRCRVVSLLRRVPLSYEDVPVEASVTPW
jgi:hypothetical protein